MHAKNIEQQKETARPEDQDEKFAGPFMRMSCARIFRHATPRPAQLGEASTRVELPLPPLNSFNQVETTQLFKLVLLHLE